MNRCPLCPPITAWVLEEWAQIARLLGCTLCDVTSVALDLRAVNHEAHAKEVAA